MEHIYRRATSSFDRADFFKPVETNTEDLAFKLAPLILQEAGPGNSNSPFGRIIVSNSSPIVVLSRPAVYLRADSVEINGKSHARFSYIWFYSISDAVVSKVRSWSAQGIRLTLNSAGYPVVWEVLGDSSGFHPIFVAESLEAAAAKQFGKPLPGRRYAVERSLAEAPETLVARVIDDGPVPMGPIIYLDSESRSASTVICRCMPAQTKALGLTKTYELLSMEAAPLEWLRPRIAGAQGQTAFWPGDESSSCPLDKALRLPDTPF